MPPEKVATRLYFFGRGRAEGGCAERTLLGGKGLSLVEMTRAGLPVPPGFIIPASCCAAYFQAGQQIPAGLDDEIRTALTWLQTQTDESLRVAVRSGAAVSMPGVMETLLNIEPTLEAVLPALRAVFDSWQGEPASAYRRHHGITDLLGTAVTVQAMCPAEVAGVLFTANPLDQASDQMLIEAVPGLGESLVQGRVTPDRFTLDRAHGQVRKRELAGGEGALPCLSDAQLRELAELGERVEKLFGHPCDIEWALAAGKFWLLQARPIAVSDDAAALEQVRREEIDRLRQRAGGRPCAWVAHNLGETLPAPTPMSWAIMRQFMSGAGGYGRMYEELGYQPSERIRREGFLDLVCGRIYLNTDRHAELFWADFPFMYDLKLLARDPSRAEAPPTRLDPSRMGLGRLLKLPCLWRRMRQVRRGIHERLHSAGLRFDTEVLPAFLKYVCDKRQQDLSHLPATELLAEFLRRRERIMDGFGREAVLIAFLAGFASEVLRSHYPLPEPSDKGLPGFVASPDQDKMMAADFQLVDVAEGRLTREAYLEQYGHRAAGEFELAHPRWREQPALVEQMLARIRAAPATSRPTTDPARQAICTPIRSLQRVDPETAVTIRRYLSLRQTAKHYWLMGYELLRTVLLEMDRRAGLKDGIFYLEPEELAPLSQGRDFSVEIAERRRRRRLCLRIFVPHFITSDNLDAIGRPTESSGQQDTLQGVGVAPGMGTGPAAVLNSPAEAGLLPSGQVLVCPSTDSGWTALFLDAAGLVLERGGVLSHGAIVARELGIPAVVLPDATRLLATGEQLHIDGARGTVSRQ